MEQEWRRPAVPDLHARLDPDPGRLRDDGLRRSGARSAPRWRPGPGGRFPRRRWRVRPEPCNARDRLRGRHAGRLGGDEQPGVRHDRGTSEGAFRDDAWHGIREEWLPIFGRFRGNGSGLWCRRRDIEFADQFKPALEAAIEKQPAGRARCIMENAPVPTTGHWNIMDIYSPGKKVTHVTT